MSETANITEQKINYFGRKEVSELTGINYLNKRLTNLFHEIEGKFVSSKAQERARLQEMHANNYSFQKKVFVSAEQTVEIGGEQLRVRKIYFANEPGKSGRPYFGIHKDDIQKVGKILGAEIADVPEEAKSHMRHTQRVASENTGEHKIYTFKFGNKELLDYDNTREYANWVKNNMREMGLTSAGDLSKLTGMSIEDTNAILNGNAVTRTEDRKLVSAFQSRNHETASDIIRDVRNIHRGLNNSRCSNASLALLTGISVTRINSITTGETLPSKEEAAIFIKRFRIGEKSANKLVSQTSDFKEKVEERKFDRALGDLLAKYNKDGKGPSRN